MTQRSLNLASRSIRNNSSNGERTRENKEELDECQYKEKGENVKRKHIKTISLKN